METAKIHLELEEVIYKPTTGATPQLVPIMAKKTSVSLYIYSAIANILGFVSGMTFGWSSPVLPKLRDPTQSPLPTLPTPIEESWIAGALLLGGAFGPLIAGRLADNIGRKKTLLLITLPMLISLLTTAFAHTIYLFYFSRFILGFGVGSMFTILPLYLAEIGQDHNRGTLGCLMGVFLSGGFLTSLIVGNLLNVRNFCLFMLVPLVLFIVLFGALTPESPQFLAVNGANYQLEISLKKLRRHSMYMEEKHITIKTIEELKQTCNSNGNNLKELISNYGLRRALIICLGLMILQQFAGINAVSAYMQPIFDATGSALSPEISTIIIGIVQFITTMITSYVVESLGRKLLLIISSLLCGLSLILLGLYFYLKSNNYVELTNCIYWLPIASLLIYFVAFNLGLGPLPWAILGELFPNSVKSIASTVVSIICFFSAFVITFCFPPLALVLGMANSFWFFGVCCFLGGAFVIFMVPETKGKSLQEIQRLLRASQKE